MKNYYAVLEVSRQATGEEIQASYKRLIKQFHPDVNKAQGAMEKTKELNEAYATLGNPEKKKTYDLQSNPFERVSQSNPNGVRVNWQHWGGFNEVVQNVVIVPTPNGQQIWVNGIRMK